MLIPPLYGRVAQDVGQRAAGAFAGKVVEHGAEVWVEVLQGPVGAEIDDAGVGRRCWCGVRLRVGVGGEDIGATADATADEALSLGLAVGPHDGAAGDSELIGEFAVGR